MPQAKANPICRATPVLAFAADYRSLEICRQADEHDLWLDTMAEGYEFPSPFADRLGPGMVANSTATSLFNHRNRAVATAVLIIRNGIISVYNISTIPNLRGRDVGRFATDEPLRLAREEEYRTAILQSLDMWEPVYQ